MNADRRSPRSLAGVMLAAAATTLAIMVTEVSAGDVLIRQRLTATGNAAHATGRVTFIAKSGVKKAKKHKRPPKPKRKFLVTVRHLRAGHTFDVIVRGVKVGTLATTARGAGTARFTNRPTSARGASLRVARVDSGGSTGEQRLGFDPRGAQVVIRDEDGGDDDLMCDVPEGPADAGSVACCLPADDEETECDEMPPLECSDAGGTPSDATSCLPDPCLPTLPPDTVCCIPETSGSAQGAVVDEAPEVECRDSVSAEACAHAGGAVVDGPSCDPNPCPPTPPSSPPGPCCVPDGDTSACEVLTLDACSASQGTGPSAPSCAPNPCGGASGGEGHE